MTDFIRKKRFLNYKSKECKKFLSKDFHKQCAYCHIREGDLGGPNNFEIDHFIPQDMGGGDFYDNLYYICSTCNGKAGKSNTWSPTLLDPCEDDIFNVHINLSPDYKMKEVTDKGDEYIKTFKLNRKSYVNNRRTIDTHRNELKKKLIEYRDLCEKIIQLDGYEHMLGVLESDIQEVENVLKYGPNYRMSINAFDEDIDDYICNELQKIGNLDYVDEDYDLYYQLEIGDIQFKCHTIVDEFCFDNRRQALRYINKEKINAWENIEK